MDKLKQVQKYQFWILLGLAVILPLVGWFVARSGMVAEAAERTKVLTTINESLKATREDPNATWERKLGEINTEQAKQKELAWRELYERQKPLMVWPANMVDDPTKILPQDQEVYRVSYQHELEKVRQRVVPDRKSVV